MQPDRFLHVSPSLKELVDRNESNSDMKTICTTITTSTGCISVPRTVDSENWPRAHSKIVNIHISIYRILFRSLTVTRLTEEYTQTKHSESSKLDSSCHHPYPCVHPHCNRTGVSENRRFHSCCIHPRGQCWGKLPSISSGCLIKEWLMRNDEEWTTKQKHGKS